MTAFEISSKTGAIILAAGSSQRMGGIDKIFFPLKGKPLIAYGVEIFQGCPAIGQIVLVFNKENLERGRELVQKQGWSKVKEVCQGGTRRQDSVAEGLKKLQTCQWVIVHDGARPCLTEDLILRGISAASSTGAAISAVPVTDTIKVVAGSGEIKETLQRGALWAAQTPQVFRMDIILEAYSQVDEEVTDDAAVVEKAGGEVKIYMGSYDNIKVTTPEDLVLAEAILGKRNASRHWL